MSDSDQAARGPAPWVNSEYRGHDVRWTGAGYTVFRSGKKLGYAISVADAKKMVDEHCIAILAYGEGKL